MVEDLDVDSYVHCLRRIYGVVSAWEQSAMGSAPEWMRPMLAARQRRTLLEQDLAHFGAAGLDVHLRADLDADHAAIPIFDEIGTLLGAMYVMEGSTLGGQFIARHVERVLQLRDGHGSAYFRGYGERTSGMWKEFCEVLQTAVPDTETDTVVAGAKAMFTFFGAWMRGDTNNSLSRREVPPAGLTKGTYLS
jgi:heme oxygenase